MSEIFIKAENVSFCYESENEAKAIPAVDNVSLEIKKGEYVAILGHNGSGKSTLAKLLNGILAPDAGELYVAGKALHSAELTEDDIFELRRRVGMVFQNPDNQLVATIVEEDVAFGPENLGVPSAEIRRRVDKALETVGMTAYARHEPHRLSGGQKQRVAIAGVLAMQPEVLVLDEATAMLDPQGRRDVLSTVERLHREEGLTLITITHYMNEAAHADRVIVLDDGKIILSGTPREVFANTKVLATAGLDVPQCTALVQALAAEGAAFGEIPVNTAECAEMIYKLWEEKHGKGNA